jgi:hypothetical protein
MRLLIALSLLHTTTSQNIYHVCGSNYTDATANCETNPTCPTGDGCPADRDTCFAIPEYACLASVTDSPTPSPLEAENITVTSSPTVPPTDTSNTTGTVAPVASPSHYFVCGVDYNDAATNCQVNELCTNGDGCLSNTTCYAIPADSCESNTSSPTGSGSANFTSSPIGANGTQTLAPSPSSTGSSNITSSPVGGTNETVTPAPSPSSSTEFTFPPSETFSTQPSPVGNITVSTSPSVLSVNTTSPTPAPTDNTRFCGANYTDASDNCSAERACLGGFECGDGETVSLVVQL